MAQEKDGALETTVKMGAEATETTTQENGGVSRRDLFKAAATVAVGAAAITASTEKKAEAAAAYKTISGIEVPVADVKKMYMGPYPKAPVVATGRAIGANDRINIAFVGVGGMGGAHVHHFADDAANRNIRIVGICDVNQKRREANKAYAIEKGAADATCKVTKDYRELLADKSVDCILIATPEHWHGQIAAHAMEAGKHVYIQKPMTRYLDEAFQVHDIALRTKRVVQIGSQGCSDYRFHAAGKAIREGRIGPRVMGQGSYTRNSATGEWNYGIDGGLSPENFDWDLWLGSSPYRPFDPKTPAAGDGEQRKRDDAKARYARYRKYVDYSAGILSDLMPHKLHPFLIASGNPEYPTRVSAIGTQLSDDREVPDTVQVIAEFPSKWSMLFVGSTVNEQGLQDMFRGYKGSIYFGNTVELRPERWASEEVEGADIPLDGPTGEPHERHEINWLDAIRGKVAQPNANIDLATKVQTIISLAEMSIRTNRAMLFDEKTRKVTTG